MVFFHLYVSSKLATVSMRVSSIFRENEYIKEGKKLVNGIQS